MDPSVSNARILRRSRRLGLGMTTNSICKPTDTKASKSDPVLFDSRKKKEKLSSPIPSSRKNRPKRRVSQVEPVAQHKSKKVKCEGKEESLKHIAKKKPADYRKKAAAKKPEDFSYPGRETEFVEILSFLEEKIVGGTGGCMCISGMPGTGKTATVQQVKEYLRSRQKFLPPFEFCDINGMALTEPREAYVVLAMAEFGKKYSHAKALSILDDYYRSADSTAEESTTMIAIIDEMDLLYSKRQKILYNLMDWPQLRGSKLVVLSIANTMDLPEKMFIARIESRMGPKRLTFHPYSSEQLESVVRYHLKDVNLTEEAMLLASKRVAGLSGDARRVLHICSRAKNIAVARGAPVNNHVMKIDIKDVLAACEELAQSPKFVFMKSASILEKAFLQGIVLEYERTGTEEARLDKVLQHTQEIYQDTVTDAGSDRVPVSTMMGVANRLAAMELIYMESKFVTKFARRLSLNCSVDDVKFAVTVKAA